jgi:hypothetical protein
MYKSYKPVLSEFKKKIVKDILEVNNDFEISYKIIFTDDTFILFGGEPVGEFNTNAYYETEESEY